MTMMRETHTRLRTLWSLAACAGLMASCANPPPTAKPSAPTVPAPSAAPAPADAGRAEPSPTAAPQPGAPVSAASAAASQKQATSAIELLEAGNEEQATAELQRALQADPNNKLAASLLRQIQSDPVAVLGRDNFAYRVQPGESISRIAQRFLGDVHLFYILSRYNDLKVPKQLHAGQMIKVPGKAPPPPAPAPSPTPPAPPPAPAPQPAPPPPPPPPAPATASAPSAADAAKAAERERLAKVTAATKAARALTARQDLPGAIKQWDIVLALDPGNKTAIIERQRAVDLLAKYKSLK